MSYSNLDELMPLKKSSQQLDSICQDSPDGQANKDNFGFKLFLPENFSCVALRPSGRSNSK